MLDLVGQQGEDPDAQAVALDDPVGIERPIARGVHQVAAQERNAVAAGELLQGFDAQDQIEFAHRHRIDPEVSEGCKEGLGLDRQLPSQSALGLQVVVEQVAAIQVQHGRVPAALIGDVRGDPVDAAHAPGDTAAGLQIAVDRGRVKHAQIRSRQALHRPRVLDVEQAWAGGQRAAARRRCGNLCDHGAIAVAGHTRRAREDRSQQKQPGQEGQRRGNRAGVTHGGGPA